MAIGPVDVYIIGFPGNKFTGQIAPAILDLVEQGIIRVLDMEFVTKDEDGNVFALQLAEVDVDDPNLGAIELVQPGALGSEDAEEISDDLAPNSSALLIAFENVWAAKLAGALQAADAEVLDYIRIPVDVVQPVINE